MQYHTKVIPFPVSPAWSFYDLIEGGANRIEAWYQEELSQDGKDSFDALLKNTGKIENHLQWGGFKFLKGEARAERIWQLDFRADKRQYRLLGVFAPGKKAILVLGCFHKGNVYAPPNAIESACKRAKALRERRATIVVRTIKNNL